MYVADLCSCSGVGAEGYANAGATVVGIDIVDHSKRYPYTFYKRDVLQLDVDWLRQFDFIHYSPPCQWYKRRQAGRRYTDNPYARLIGPGRELLLAAGVPFVIENVIEAREDLIDPIMLCGTMFPGLRVFRHRLFEAHGFELKQPNHAGNHDGIVTHTFDVRKLHFGTTDEWTDFVQVTGGGNCTKAAALDAMGIPHRWDLRKEDLNEGIPPAYTEYIFRSFLESR